FFVSAGVCHGVYFRIMFDYAGSAGRSFASALLEFLLLWLVGDWLSLLSLVREVHPLLSSDRDSLSWLAFQQGPSVSCRRVLLLLLGARAASVVAVSLVLRLGSSSACASVWVCREGLESLRVMWPSPVQGCGLRNRYGEVLPKFFSVGSGGSEVFPRTVLCLFLVVAALPSGLRLRCIVWLPCVLVRFPRTVGCCPGEVRSQDCSGLVSAGYCATSGLRYAVVVLAVAFCLFGLRSGDVFPERLLALWVEGREVGFVSRALWALPDDSLVSAMGVWLLGVLVVSHAFGAMSRTVATFVANVPPLVLCALEAIIAIGRVALPTCGGRSGALCLPASKSQYGCLLWRVLPVSRVVSAVGAIVLHLAWFWCLWWHHVLVIRWFVLFPSCVASRVCSVFEALSFPPLGHFVLANALWLYRYRCGVAALPCLGRRVVFDLCGCFISGAVCRRLELSGLANLRLFLVGLVRAAPMELSTSACVLCAVVVRPTDRSGCRGVPVGRVLVAVWAAVALRLVTRRPAPSRSEGRRRKALVGSPFPFFGFSPFPPFRGGEGFPLSSGGGSLAERWRLVRSVGASSWSEEEAAVAS
ncbi:hypothetical protein Taro_003196, partial [Colocasia esculenta]|nr:hypothetical protein [Colocasia esculenta]